jgi:hypothetical protein
VRRGEARNLRVAGLLAAMSVRFPPAVITMQPIAVFAEDHMVTATNSVVLNADNACGAMAMGRTP